MYVDIYIYIHIYIYILYIHIYIYTYIYKENVALTISKSVLKKRDKMII